MAREIGMNVSFSDYLEGNFLNEQLEAINEISILRQSRQAASLLIKSGTKNIIKKLRGDGFHYVDAELLDASAPNRPGPYEFDTDGTVSLSAPSKGLAGFSHSIQLRQGAQQASETISGVSIEFYTQQVFDSAGDNAEEGAEPLLSLTPYPDGVPKITAVLVSANNQPADQVDFHGQCKLISATATSSADGHAAFGLGLDASQNRVVLLEHWPGVCHAPHTSGLQVHTGQWLKMASTHIGTQPTPQRRTMLRNRWQATRR